MAKVMLKGITVHNIEPCPKCQAEEWSYVNEQWRFYEMHCSLCDYKAPGSIIMRSSKQYSPEVFKEQTRSLFNLWNEGVSKELGQEVKKVRIVKNDL